MGDRWLLRLLAYAASLTIAASLGALIINVFSFPLLNPGSTLLDGLWGFLGLLGFLAILVIPLAIVFFVLAALVMGLLRRYTWWTGALAGLIPTAVFATVGILLDATVTYAGPPEQLAAAQAIRVTVAVMTVAWGAVAGSVLAGLFSPRRFEAAPNGITLRG